MVFQFLAGIAFLGEGILFGEKALRNIFVASLAAAVIFPLMNIFLIYPLFSELITGRARDSALMVAEHLKYSVSPRAGSPGARVKFERDPGELKRDLNLLGIEVFSAEGEVLYSDLAGEAGPAPSEFVGDIVKRGKSRVRMEKIQVSRAGGEMDSAEAVTAFVPIEEDGKFAGVLGIYYDMTKDKQRLENTVFYFSVIPVVSAVSFLAVIAFLLRQVNRNSDRRRRVEEELRSHKENLEKAILERTSELASANRTLEGENQERRLAENALRRSGSFMETIFASIHDPFCIFDREFRVVKVNEGYARLKDSTQDELVGGKCYEMYGTGDGVCEGCVVLKTLESGKPCTKDKMVEAAGGETRWLELYTYPIFEDNGRISHVIEYTRDITDRKKTETERNRLIEELEYLSSIDGLTGLLNRRALLERLDDEMDRSSRYESGLSLIICDVDYFKDINDNYGHLAGDKALKCVARTLSGFLRKSDIAGRYGGDEFMVILPGTDADGAGKFAERIRAKLAVEKIEHPDCDPFRISLSFGISCFRSGMHRADDLIVPADNALYESKSAGRDIVTLARERPEDGRDAQTTIPFG